MRFLNMIFTLIVVLSSTAAFAATQEGAINLADDHAVYYKYNEAKNGQPTVVLLNGLIYPINNWKTYFNKLSALGYGVVQISYSTLPEDP